VDEHPAADDDLGQDDIGRYGYRQELKRSLRFGDLLVYGLIFMVPIAPFGIFGSVYQGSGGMVALAYLVGMVAMMFTASSYTQMSRAFPMAGSVYTYAGRGISPPIGFLAGWVIILDYVLVPALLYLVAGVAMNSLLPAIPVWLWLVAFVLLNTAVNYLGIEMTARVNKVMLVGELLVLLVFLVVGVVALAQGKGTGSVGRRCTTARRSPGRWCSGRCRSRCCRSSGSTASRCSPRRTGSPPGRSAERCSPH
jgi:amino acid transporter